MSGKDPSSRVRATLVDDSGDVQLLQVEDHGVPSAPDVPHALPYGLAVGLPLKAEGLLEMIGGAVDHVVAWGFRVAAHRPRNLKPGDVTLYSGHGVRVDLREGGVMIVIPDGATVQLGGRVARAIHGDLFVPMVMGHTHVVIDGIAQPSTDLIDAETTLSDVVLLG